LQRHFSPADSARELFKPFSDSASLLIKIENKVFSFWVWGFLWATSQVGGVFSFFGQLCPVLGANPMSQFFGSSFF